MRIIVIGTGIVGTIYGWALTEAGHRVVHLVRPHQVVDPVKDVPLDIWDERKKHPRRVRTVYRRYAVSQAPAEGADLVLAAVKARQLAGVLSAWSDVLAPAPFVLMSPVWRGEDEVSPYLEEDRIVYSDSQSGGRVQDGDLVAALGDELPVDAQLCPRLRDLVESVFGAADIRLAPKPNILHWNWVQHASNGGFWPALVAAGSFPSLFRDYPMFLKGMAATKETLEICRQRGVDLDNHPEASFYLVPPGCRSRLVFFLMRMMLTYRTSMKRVSAHALDDPQEIWQTYQDLLEEGTRRKLPMPTFRSLGPAVEAFANRGVPR